MSDPILHLQNIYFQYGSSVVLNDFSWKISKGEHWMISGSSGSGKTTLAKIISGESKNFEGKVELHFSKESSLPAKVLYVSNWFCFTNLDGDRNFYYQQRYNTFSKKEIKTVFAELKDFGKEENLDFENVEEYLHIFGFENFREQQLIELSSGEHKRLQLVKALWLQPQLLILDQPYTGLDVQSRKNLDLMLGRLAEEGVTLLLINNEEEFPACISHFAEIKNGKLFEFLSSETGTHLKKRNPKELPNFLRHRPAASAETMVKMKAVNISYGEKHVLKNIFWEVKSGDRWLIQGHNGSGKSTLLSLISADHPQAYANEIDLFGTPRGSGESIWEIKEKIGMISPEMHWYYDMNANVAQTVASGFFDSASLYQKLNFDQQQKLIQLLYFFDLKEDQNKKLSTLPLGKQRLALLARTIVKNPELLILDEPCQGLDPEQTAYFNAIVDELCRFGQTLIYVGHFDSRLPSCIDHRLILEKGSVKEVFKTQEVAAK